MSSCYSFIFNWVRVLEVKTSKSIPVTVDCVWVPSVCHSVRQKMWNLVLFDVWNMQIKQNTLRVLWCKSPSLQQLQQNSCSHVVSNILGVITDWLQNEKLSENSKVQTGFHFSWVLVWPFQAFHNTWIFFLLQGDKAKNLHEKKYFWCISLHCINLLQLQRYKTNKYATLQSLSVWIRDSYFMPERVNRLHMAMQLFYFALSQIAWN